MSGVAAAFGVSLLAVFLAELGDKSQLMALTFATRYRFLPVLAGITIATAVVHLVSVAVGHGLGAALPTGWISLVAALAFVGFGLWTLRGDALDDEEQAKAGRAHRSAVVAASVAFFLAELGDKTMLATIALAARYDGVGVWLGSTVGMVAADALAIVVGIRLGSRLPVVAVRRGSATLLFGFGAWLGVDAVGELTGVTAAAALSSVRPVAAWLALGLVVVLVVLGRIGGHRLRVLRHSPAHQAVRRAAQRPAARWARLLFQLAAALGLFAPVLVIAGVVEPVRLLLDPGLVVIGAGLAVLGMALVVASQARVGSGPPDAPAPATGLRAHVRNPGLTGMVVAMAGALLVTPTLLGVVATVVLLVAVQLQARGVREPVLAGFYGPAFAEYAARTGRFLPRLRR